jgi:mannose-6-phosphate isomerase-like protein (cupin superfamily)
VITQATRGCLILAHDRLIAVNGLKDLVVVETPDSIFVSDIDHSRDVKSIVAELKQRGRSEVQQHLTLYFPWGTRTLLEESDGRRTSRLAICPGASAVLEAPAGAAVHLFLLSGCAKVSAGRRRRRLSAGDAWTLPAAPPIRIENPQADRLQLIQVAADGGWSASET